MNTDIKFGLASICGFRKNSTNQVANAQMRKIGCSFLCVFIVENMGLEWNTIVRKAPFRNNETSVSLKN